VQDIEVLFNIEQNPIRNTLLIDHVDMPNMNETWDILMSARSVGLTLLFAAMFGAFFIVLANPLENGIRMLIYVIIGVAAIVWATGSIWNFLEG